MLMTFWRGNIGKALLKTQIPYFDFPKCGCVFTSMTVRNWGRCPKGCRPKTDAEVALELMEQLYQQRTT
jgi:hypothetical protein